MTHEEMIDIVIKEIIKIEKLKLSFVKDQDFTTAEQLRQTERVLRNVLRHIQISKEA